MTRLIAPILPLVLSALLLAADGAGAVEPMAKKGAQGGATAERRGASQAGPGLKGNVGQRADTAAPLTAGECAGLGGIELPVANCKSGNACFRSDQNGVIHRVGCIRKAD